MILTITAIAFMIVMWAALETYNWWMRHEAQFMLPIEEGYESFEMYAEPSPMEPSTGTSADVDAHRRRQDL